MFMRKLLMGLTLVTALAGTAFAGEPGYTPANGTGCKVFNPSVEPGDSVTWSGSCSNGYASGNGTLQWYTNGTDAGQYQGAIKEGKRHGTGIYKWTDGSSYSGGWANGKMHGKGVYILKDGTQDEAVFVDGNYHGHGIRTKTAGKKYAFVAINNYFYKYIELVRDTNNCFVNEMTRDGVYAFIINNRDSSGYEPGKTDIMGTSIPQDRYIWKGDCYNGLANGSGLLEVFNGRRSASGDPTAVYKTDVVNGVSKGIITDVVTGKESYIYYKSLYNKVDYETTSSDLDYILSHQKLEDVVSYSKSKEANNKARALELYDIIIKAYGKTYENDKYIESHKLRVSVENAKAERCNANIPNDSPIPNETASFYGECIDDKPQNGIIVWNQRDIPFSATCMKNGKTVSGYNFSECDNYINYLPNSCTTGSYRGQCKNGIPDGVGVRAWKDGDGIVDFIGVSGQYKNGKLSGYGTYSIIRRCGAFGCSGGSSTYHAWYSNDVEQFRCDGGPDGCIKKKDAEPLFLKAEQLAKNFKCEEALKYDREGQSKDGQKHDSDYTNGARISFSSCVAERTLNSHLASKNPQSMYLAAGQYERDGNTYYAKKVYNSLIHKFPNSQWSIKANDRLLNIKSDSDASNRQSEFESNRRYEREKDAQSCRNRKSSCWSSCSDIKDYTRRSNCQSGCQSICSE